MPPSPLACPSCLLALCCLVRKMDWNVSRICAKITVYGVVVAIRKGQVCSLTSVSSCMVLLIRVQVYMLLCQLRHSNTGISHVEYCAPVWNPHLKKDTDALEKIQKRGARWICCRWSQQSHSWSRTYEDACTHLGWKPPAQGEPS